MNPHTYVRLDRPWKVAVDVAHPGPSRVLARLLDETIRNRVPAYGRTAALRNLAARRGMPRALAVAAVRRRSSRPDPELESLRIGLGAAAILLLERRSCQTVFIFDRSDEPTSVAKLPRPGDQSVSREHGVLQQLAGLAVAPAALEVRTLPNHGSAFLQEMVSGEPLRLHRWSGSRSFPWDEGLDSACAGLARLAEHTGGPLDATDLEPAQAVLRETAVSSGARREVEVALQNIGDRGVLRHGDTSPQNVLIEDGAFAGLVDWELAKAGGAPGFDIMNLALATFERSVALRRLTARSIGEAFAASWATAPFWQQARRWADLTADTAGAHPSYRKHLVTLFFARRLGRRLQGVHHSVARDLSLSALEVVCER